MKMKRPRNPNMFDGLLNCDVCKAIQAGLLREQAIARKIVSQKLWKGEHAYEHPGRG